MKLIIYIESLFLTTEDPIKITYLLVLAQKVEKLYTNDWLLHYNDKWQSIIDDLENWPVAKKL